MGLRSRLEKRVASIISRKYLYEDTESKIKYTINHTYLPDFIWPTQPDILFEVKGYFRDSKEASKYVHIKRSNPDIELIFIFSNPFKKAHSGCRKRKDGTVLTLEEWCNKHGFLFYHEKNLPKEIVNGTINRKWVKQQRKSRGLTS